jgi:ATP-binding cassette, subfamily B, bacterial MsbA
MSRRKRRPKWAIAKRVAAEFLFVEKYRLAAAIACTFGAGLATAGVAAAVKPFLDFIFIEKQEGLLLPVTLLIIALMVVREATVFGQAALMNALMRRVATSIQFALFSRMVRADLKLFHGNATGKIHNRVSGDVSILRAALSASLISLSRDSILVISLFGLMFYRDPLLSLVVLVGLPVTIWPVKSLGRRLHAMTAERMRKAGNYSGHLNEVLTNIKAVKSYVREDVEIAETHRMLRAIEAAILKCVVLVEAVAPAVQLVMGISVVGAVFYGGHLVINETMTPGQFFSFLTALTWMFTPLRRLATSNVKLQEGLAAAERIYSVLDAEPEIKNDPAARTLVVSTGFIKLQGINFRHSGERNVKTLVNMDMDIPGGKTTALVGPTGAGKSTILDLILRFYDPSEGSISIDGQDIRSVTISSLRSNVGFVSQEPAIFQGTIASNIRYGAPNASDDEVQRVARLVGADQFIEQLSGTYNAKVGPRGVTLSGGQRQLIAIARAMLRNSPILLLDEPTASLDGESERQVRMALQQLMSGRTVVVIAHRLSTVTQADKIYVLDEGNVVESGRHEELLRIGGLYFRLYRLQTGPLPLHA